MNNQIQTASEVKDSSLTSTLAHETRAFAAQSASCFVAAAIAFSVAFTSCNKDEDGVSEISGVIDNAAKFSEVTTVRITARYEAPNGNWTSVVIAESTFSNGRFTIQLPETVDARYLRTIGFDDEPNIKVSNTKAKMLEIWDVGGYKGNEQIAGFSFEKYEETSTSYSYTSRAWIYVDSNVKIEGKIEDSGKWVDDEDGKEWEWEETFTWALDLKKGWNVVYYTEAEAEQGNKYTEKEEFTSKPVSGLRWIGDLWSDDD